MKSTTYAATAISRDERDQAIRFSILITTRNRRHELKRTLESIERCMGPNDELIVLDDASIDGTRQMLQARLCVHRVLHHETSTGLIAARNELLESARGQYAVVLDDDAEFISADPLSEVERAFNRYPNAAVLAFPIYWGLDAPEHVESCTEMERQVRSWLGGGHAIRLSAWKQIDGYPSWFVFGSEEQHAAMQFFRIGYNVLYIPSVLVHHRVSVIQRRSSPDAWYKYWRSLHAGWCVFLLFYPMPHAVRALLSSMVGQLRRRMVGGRSIQHVRWFLRALLELHSNARRLLVERRPLTQSEYDRWQKIDEPIVYWSPKQRS